ncbi:MAG: basic amino acid ABC transporter substrate-binding protein [Candidatus Limiplasma sp.]|nr:basic amino acid ABC transporter substrate-binding protein [Candidatus Limiplasma sp.]
MNMKKIAALVLALMISLTAVSALADTLVMCTNASFPPYEYVEGDKVVGIDADIAAAICEKLGYDLQIDDMEFDSLIAAVQSGKADFAMAGMTVTEERQQMINFSDSYATGIQSVIVKEDSDITSVDDLFAEGANHTVGVQLSTTGDSYTTGDIEEAGLGTVQRFPNGNEAVMALVNGKIDCVVIDNEPAKAYVAANPGLKVLDSSYAVEDYAAAIAKDNTELLEKFNAALAELKADGTIDAIIAKYISAE